MSNEAAPEGDGPFDYASCGVVTKLLCSKLQADLFANAASGNWLKGLGGVFFELGTDEQGPPKVVGIFQRPGSIQTSF
eukprot:8765231-Pyramimonas_sp.AAC.1